MNINLYKLEIKTTDPRQIIPSEHTLRVLIADYIQIHPDLVTVVRTNEPN
jgi:hypothetical protein